MSDTQASAHALDYVEKTIAGKPVKFGKLSARDRERILQSAKKAAREELAQAVADSGLAPDQKYVELRTHDTALWGLRKWAELANSYDGQLAIFTAALKRQNYSDPAIEQILSDLSLPQQEEMELVCELANLPMTAPAPLGTRQIGVLNGQPVYIAIEGAGEANPTSPAPTETATQAKAPASYGK